MTKSKPIRFFRAKLVTGAVLAVAIGITLLVVSQRIQSEVPTTQPAQTAAPTTAPTTAPADSPATPESKQLAAQNLGGLLLMFGLVAFVIAIICIGWLVHDIRKSRPAWKKHKKYRWQR